MKPSAPRPEGSSPEPTPLLHGAARPLLIRALAELLYERERQQERLRALRSLR